MSASIIISEKRNEDGSFEMSISYDDTGASEHESELLKMCEGVINAAMILTGGDINNER